MIFNSNLDDVIAQIKSKAQTQVTKGTEHMRERIIDKVSGSGDGHLYTIPGTNVQHQASSPGNPPAKMTGYLSSHIMTEYDTEDDGNVIVGFVGPQDTDYAKRMEFGFEGEDSLGRVYDQKPRPFMSTTAFEQEENVKRILKGGEPTG